MCQEALRQIGAEELDTNTEPTSLKKTASYLETEEREGTCMGLVTAVFKADIRFNIFCPIYYVFKKILE